MSNEVQHFKMEDVQARVAETIKAQFAMMIPDEAFDTMAKMAIDDFFKTEKSYRVSRHERRVAVPGSYHDRTESWHELATPLTPFKLMMWEAIRELVAAKLKEWSTGQQDALKAEIDKFFETGSEFQGEVADNLENLAKKMAAAMQTSILTQASGMAHTSLQGFASMNNLRMPGY